MVLNIVTQTVAVLKMFSTAHVSLLAVTCRYFQIIRFYPLFFLRNLKTSLYIPSVKKDVTAHTTPDLCASSPAYV